MAFFKVFFFLLLNLLTLTALAAQKTVLVMGDSLSAGYGIKVEQGWVNLLQQELRKTTDTKIVNASVSGETTSGGFSRLPALLKQHKPDIVILELGANDGLRGQSLKLMQENLQSMIDLSMTAGAKVILAGMQIPTNYGPRYTSQFRTTFSLLAEKNKLPLIPFLLENVAGHSDLIQDDGLHPTAAAQPIILNNVLPVLKTIL